MDKFLMICYVSAVFGPNYGEVFTIKPSQIGIFVEAPVWIKETLMYKWLLKDGSIKVAEEQITKKQGENDPLEGVSAEGKDEKVSEEAEAEVKAELIEEKPKKTRKAKAVDAK